MISRDHYDLTAARTLSKMDNGTLQRGGGNASSNYNGKVVWIACQSALSFMTLILIYISVCLIWFVKSKRNQSRTTLKDSDRNSSRDDERNRGTAKSSTASKRLRLRSLMRYTALFAAASTLLKFLVDQVKFFYAWHAGSDFVCELIYDITDVAMFYFAYMGVYSFLWIKQWLFYCDPLAAKFLYSRRLVIFSRAFAIIVFTVSLAVAAANWIPSRYKASNISPEKSEEFKIDFSSIGCVAIYDMSDPSTQWPLITYTVLNATFQITLLSLFTYPLLWDKLSRWKNSKRVSGRRQLPGCVEVNISSAKRSPIPKVQRMKEDDNSSIDSRREDAAICRRHDCGRSLSKSAALSIRRTICWTAVCIVTDASLVAAFAKISVGTPQVLIAVATDFDLLINIICILATYSNWKRILFPLCTKKTLVIQSSAHFFSLDASK